MGIMFKVSFAPRAPPWFVVNDTDWEARGKNIVSWCSALCGGVTRRTEKPV
jgi:hypothetical protein